MTTAAHSFREASRINKKIKKLKNNISITGVCVVVVVVPTCVGEQFCVHARMVLQLLFTTLSMYITIIYIFKQCICYYFTRTLSIFSYPVDKNNKNIKKRLQLRL